MKKNIFYLFTIIIILGSIYGLIKSNNEIKSTIAYIVAMLSFFFGPGAFSKIKDWFFGKSSAKLVIKNVERTFSSSMRDGTLQNYNIEICILNVGQVAVIKRICLNTDKGLFQMKFLGSGEINTGGKITAIFNAKPAMHLKINGIFVEDYYENKWFMDKSGIQSINQSFEIFLEDIEERGYKLPIDF